MTLTGRRAQLSLLILALMPACADDAPTADDGTTTSTSSSGGEPASDASTGATTTAANTDSSSESTSGAAFCPPAEGPGLQPLGPLADPLESSVHTVSPTLAEYVEALDPAYDYTLVDEADGPGFTLYTFTMTSLQWRSEDEISPSTWTHWIGLVVPEETLTGKAHLIITGGSVGEPQPDLDLLPLLAPIAVETGTPLAILGQIPAQPSTAPDRPESMREDTLVAYSWRKAMDTLDPRWAAYYPMVKASTRAMDTVEDFLDQTTGSAPDGYIVTGFSKRGATAWLTAAVDPRVEAVVPGVFNALNLAELAENQLRTYQAYADAADDYSNENVLQELRSPEGRFIRQVVDPINYRRALTMPHYVLQATGDEFFLTDSSRLFLDAIPGEALQRIIPNEGHSLDENLDDNLSGLIAWYQAVLSNTPRPVISESVADGMLTVVSDREPSSVTLWTAHNPEGRDFRFESVGAIWEPIQLVGPPEGVDEFAYSTELSDPSEGYTARVVELRYDGVNGREEVYSSHVYVAPVEYPHPLMGSPVVAQTRQPLEHWQCELSEEDADTVLEPLLPILVRGEHFTSADQVLDALFDVSTIEAEARARCLTVRLNIESGDLDWYTEFDDGARIWEHVATSDQEEPEAAAQRCHALNMPAPL